MRDFHRPPRPHGSPVKRAHSTRARATAFLAAPVLVAAAASVGVVAATAAQGASAGCQVTYTVGSQWAGGFTAAVGITNLGSALSSWTLTWTFPSGQQVVSGWNADYAQNGSRVTASNLGYNGSLATGATTSIGFNGSWSTGNTSPTNFAVNGVTCTGSVATGSPTATATSSATPTATASASPTPTNSATSPPPAGGALYVSPNGGAGSAGTLTDPTTITAALGRIGAGGTIYLRGGTYNLAQTVTIAAGNDGTPGARKTLSAYPGETPVLDFAVQSEASANRGLQLDASYWHLYGLVVQHAGDNGIAVGGSDDVIERTVTRANRDTGLQISRISSSTPQSAWPSDNLVISCESYDNADSAGENADGFAAKLTVGTGNVFRYDVSHNNIDDGWDLFTKTDTGAIGPVTIEYSLSYDQGTLTNGTQAANGDRNGFKLGGDKIAVNHVVEHDIAYQNGHDGFTYNNNPGAMTVSNNVSIDNGERNFHWETGASVFRDDTSCRFSTAGGGSNDKLVGDVDGSDQFWAGADGSRCAGYSGTLGWSFASDGHLAV
ncbi:MAG: cellulose binding domain-containing protein, partial [Actinocrinis sp.]